MQRGARFQRAHPNCDETAKHVASVPTTMNIPAYLIFDVESVADGELVEKLRYGGRGFTPREAVAQYRAELMEKYAHNFIPYTYLYPVSVAVAKVAGDFRLIDVVVLDAPEFRPHVITEKFWRGW